MNTRYRLTAAAFFILAFLFIAYEAKKNQPEPRTQLAAVGQSAEVVFIPAAQSQFSGCTVSGAFPDPECTPGAYFTEATTEQICTPGYSKSVRSVSEKTKKAVYAEYGVTRHETGEYEVDHFIPLELGGSNDISNLFPEAAEPRPGFHEKDKVENYLHDQVCKGLMKLNEAQKEIATDWYAVYPGIQ